MLKFYTPVHVNVILFENRVFCRCNHVKMKSFWGTVGPNSVHLCLYEERRRDIYKVYKEGECHVTTKEEIGFMWPQVKKYQGLLVISKS